MRPFFCIIGKSEHITDTEVEARHGTWIKINLKIGIEVANQTIAGTRNPSNLKHHIILIMRFLSHTSIATNCNTRKHPCVNFKFVGNVQSIGCPWQQGEI